MDQKIAWYKEILELEPSSKIFFPLARLLLRDGLREHAIDILRQGLSYHKDFFEARLMLIELLHDAGDTVACDAEVRTLLAPFSDYPQFWNAWSSCLAQDGAKNDVSLAMRFIAASQQCSDISFASLLDKGLQSFEKRDTFLEGETSTLQAETPPLFGLVASPPAFFEQDALHDVNADKAAELVQPMDYADFLLQETPEAAFDEMFAQEVHYGIASDINVVAESDDAVFRAHSDSCPKKSALMPDTASTQHITTYFEHEVYQKDDDSTGVFSSAEVYQPAEQKEEISEELFTLRTRSMADVLLAQGDVQGALSIYEELLHNETDESAQLDIQERIDALRQNKICLESVEVLDEPCHGKDKLLQMLTLLAERLETRAQ